MPALTRTLVPLLLGLAATPAWSAPTADVPVPAPRIASGDTWLYRHTEEGQSTDILQRVVETGPDGGYVIEGQEIDFGGYQRQRYDGQQNLLSREMSAHKSIRYEPSYPAFRFPLEPGASWSGEVAIRRSWDERFAVDRSLSYRVTGWEDVTVPAGTFHALHVAGEGRNSGTNGERPSRGRFTDEYWYAPAVKRWVRRETDEPNGPGRRRVERWELVEYTLKP